MAEGRNTARWLIRASTALDLRYRSGEGVAVSKRELGDNEREAMRRELAGSTYALRNGNAGAFLDACKKVHVFSMGAVKISAFTNAASRELASQAKRSLFRVQAIMDMFDVRHGIDVFLVPTREKRRRPKGDEVVMPAHINGGYTYAYTHPQRTRIFIYRLEEWPKVLLHEVLHNVPQVQDIPWQEGDIHKMYGMFGIDSRGCPKSCKTVLEPTEAVVEAWAIFLHTAFLAHETGDSFDRLLAREIGWNDHHTRWMIEKKEMELNGKWSEGTHAFSYIVLRGIILHSLDRFLGMRMPYSPRALVGLWGSGWRKIRKVGDRERGRADHDAASMRMSVHGDL